MLLTLPSDLYLIFYILSKHFNLILIKLSNFMVEHLSTNFGLNVFKVARSSFLARAAWAADCACSREHTRLTQVQIWRSCTLENFAKFIFRSKISLNVDGENL